jgi:hypothetical protein
MERHLNRFYGEKSSGHFARRNCYRDRTWETRAGLTRGDFVSVIGM